ncbi:MAG: FeoB-associated Cys-rich membrane protein [Treponema sp.]|jgi:hypothetical protein|nr:FeoB-associated Cys-rich membrane protein [Treponema sp.]
MGTLLVTIILAAIVSAIIVKMVKDHKKGKSTCGHSCGSCGSCAACKNHH